MGINMREDSRENYTDRKTHEDLQLGCLQRIADASEKMAQNHSALIDERDRYKRWYEQERAEGIRMRRQIAALRGVINRMKKGAKK